MYNLKNLFKQPMLQCCLLAAGLLLVFSQSAYADLESSITDMQSKIQGICTPLAIIFLIIAGWQKAIGNNFLFIAALTGTLVMFAAPNLVTFISGAFGGQ